MFKHLLVPLDGSGLAETALPLSGYIARVLDAKVTLLHIVERDAPEEIHGERHLTSPDQAREYLDEVARRAFPEGVPVERRIESGEANGVARRIQAYASSAGIDLIVMCTHGRSGIRHLLLGSNSQQVVAMGTIPVLQVRPSVMMRETYDCRRILSPVDGEPAHEKGLHISAGLARKCVAGLHVLQVVPTLRTMRRERAASARLAPGTSLAMLDLSLKEAQEYLARQAENLCREDLKISTGIERGDPAGTILRVAKRTQSDLIVLATHRKAGADAFWSESVAPSVTKRSTVPVLLIPL
jgi:nucleotide-binding universal stress UspA family protein